MPRKGILVLLLGSLAMSRMEGLHARYVGDGGTLGCVRHDGYAVVDALDCEEDRRARCRQLLLQLFLCSGNRGQLHLRRRRRCGRRDTLPLLRGIDGRGRRIVQFNHHGRDLVHAVGGVYMGLGEQCLGCEENRQENKGR